MPRLLCPARPARMAAALRDHPLRTPMVARKCQEKRIIRFSRLHGPDAIVRKCTKHHRKRFNWTRRRAISARQGCS
eukprot:9496053-Pyramimonas_sp.AAC.1